jgi:hypothetical protein
VSTGFDYLQDCDLIRNIANVLEDGRSNYLIAIGDEQSAEAGPKVKFVTCCKLNVHWYVEGQGWIYEIRDRKDKVRLISSVDIISRRRCELRLIMRLG